MTPTCGSNLTESSARAVVHAADFAMLRGGERAVVPFLQTLRSNVVATFCEFENTVFCADFFDGEPSLE